MFPLTRFTLSITLEMRFIMPVKKVSRKVLKTHEQSAFELPHSPITNASQPTGRRKIKVLIGISLITIVIFITGLNYFLHYQKNQNVKTNPILASELEQETIVSKIGKLIELPATEAPTIATVTDITKLNGQPFFQHAKKGDIVLIYPKANEAILYDPIANKILELGPINNNPQTTAMSNAAVAGASTQSLIASPTPAPVNVALYNGTMIDGLTRKIQVQLAQVMPNVTVVQNANASKQDYANTIVIDLTDKQSAMAQQIAKALHGTVGSMPSNETVPVDADILVILGKQN